MPTALCFPNERRWHHRDCFVEGLTRLGFTITRDLTRTPSPGDVLVTWNRMRADDPYARRYEQAGAAVIVTENGWIGQAPDGAKLFALCLDHHNGAGRWPQSADNYSENYSRWDALGIELKPWRPDGDRIVILAQRGFGPPEVAMPREWPRDVAQRLSRASRRRVVLRNHPGPHKIGGPLEDALQGAWAVVTWGSGAGIKAIALGIPVFYEMPAWIGALAARPGIKEIESPFLGDRLPMLRRLAWAQWSASEIASGEPIARLLTGVYSADCPN